jgi:holo-[acyl-carrier protein] synthase
MKNIGIDIIKNERFDNKLEDDLFISRILSTKEKEVFTSFNSRSRKVEYLAGRFAAKEAIIKAINKTSLSFDYKDISVLNDENGSPYVEFSFKVDFYILLSISHTDENSVAVAVMV